MTQPNNGDAQVDDLPDLQKTHVLVDLPGFGKIWAIKDIAAYYEVLRQHIDKVVEAYISKLDFWLRWKDDPQVWDDIKQYKEYLQQLKGEKS